MDVTQDEGRRPADEVAAIIKSEPAAMAGAPRKHQCRKGLLLKQFSGRLTASNLVLKSSDGHLEVLLTIKLIFKCSDILCCINISRKSSVFLPW